ncbi:MAG: class I SAM-dependent methyltransferase [Polyangiaceae bacterium]|nr:class I SAM-dependent methyltransferase [Polyangiaceae bacterium]
MSETPKKSGPLSFAAYDQRKYRTLDVRDGYAIWSAIYGDLDDRFDIELLEASPGFADRIAGARVVDLGCGTGRIGAWVASRGATAVTGVDLSPQMLERATARNVYARLVESDITRTPIAGASFDGAVSSLVVDHVASLTAFFTEAARLVRPGGFLAVVDYHPFFMMKGVPTHFDHPQTGESIAIVNHVHALRDFFRDATACGFRVVDFDERFIDEAWVTQSEGYKKHLGMPVSHLWVYERA